MQMLCGRTCSFFFACFGFYFFIISSTVKWNLMFGFVAGKFIQTH